MSDPQIPGPDHPLGLYAVITGLLLTASAFVARFARAWHEWYMARREKAETEHTRSKKRFDDVQTRRLEDEMMLRINEAANNWIEKLKDEVKELEAKIDELEPLKRQVDELNHRVRELTEQLERERREKESISKACDRLEMEKLALHALLERRRLDDAARG